MMTEILAPALKNDHNAHLLRDELCGYVGFGALRPGRAFVCEAHRATMVGGGVIQQGKCHIHRIPLPDGVHGHTDWRRLTITLAWFSPTNPGDRRYRKADLSFNPPADKASPLRVNRVHADWQAAKRGTVQHEVLEDPRRVINLADQTTLEIPVMCREDAPRLDEAIPYALVVSLEVGEEVGIPIYQQVRDALRVRPRVRVR